MLEDLRGYLDLASKVGTFGARLARLRPRDRATPLGKAWIALSRVTEQVEESVHEYLKHEAYQPYLGVFDLQGWVKDHLAAAPTQTGQLDIQDTRAVVRQAIRRTEKQFNEHLPIGVDRDVATDFGVKVFDDEYLTPMENLAQMTRPHSWMHDSAALVVQVRSKVAGMYDLLRPCVALCATNEALFDERMRDCSLARELVTLISELPRFSNRLAQDVVRMATSEAKAALKRCGTRAAEDFRFEYTYQTFRAHVLDEVTRCLVRTR